MVQKMIGHIFVVGDTLVCHTVEDLPDGKQKETWMESNCETEEQFTIEKVVKKTAPPVEETL